MKADCLLWEKYRPKKMSSIILLPRIKDFLKNGIHTNLIFYGSPGTGKTSLARILTKEYDTLELNSSYFTSVETLRGVITDHIKTLNYNYDPNGTKIVFLDEFDGVSQTYQDALKGFAEEYNEYARFILTTNHINKIKELDSRFNRVNFDPISQKESEYLKEYYFKYLKAVVKDIQEEELITDDIINKISNKFFPDLRASVQMIQEVQISRNIDLIETSSASSYYIDLYNFILNGDNNVIDNYKYAMANYQDNPESAFQVLGRPFFSYLLEMKEDLIVKRGGSIMETQKNYNATLSVTIDPLVHLMAYMYDLKEIINKK